MSFVLDKVTSEQADNLRKLFLVSGWTVDQPQYTQFRAKEGKRSCTVYNSGKLLVQGKETQMILDQFVSIVIPIELEPEVEEVSADYIDHIGIDESGKGDFFGPLVTAAVFVDISQVDELIALGVKDSKVIKSDKEVLRIAAKIRKTCSYDLLKLDNTTYNNLYSKIGNLNKLLAWCHATVLENLLEKNPNCEMAISDQFAASKRTLQMALKERGKKINLIQMTKAESDIAVAAASIIARAEFVSSMKKMSLAMHSATAVPKGASAKVKQFATDFAQKHGKSELSKYAKTHFKTYAEL